MSHTLCFLVGEWYCHLLEQRRDVCVFVCPGHHCRKDDFLVTMSTYLLCDTFLENIPVASLSDSVVNVAKIIVQN